MKKVRVILAGGFLGAGKTTSVIQLANLLSLKGIKAGIITNDQGNELVDGRLIKLNGIPGTEVKGGCFCCHFNDFIREINSLIKEYDPDVLIAEPVGSCTDLVSTVFLPLQKYYPDNFILGPLSVITDGRLLYQAMSSSNFPFSEEILYLYWKQIEECNILLINKTDILKEEEKLWLLKELNNKYPGTTIIPISALNGVGIEEWIGHLLEGDMDLKPLKVIDYKKYGLAESMLGWYNSCVNIKGKILFDPNDLVEDILEDIIYSIKKSGGNIAHMKTITETGCGIIKAGIVGIEQKINFTKIAYDLTRDISFIINARVEMSPEILKDIINLKIEECCRRKDLEVIYGYEECFKPSFPSPTYKGVS
ncbi:MAG TPA: GTP-binding protein [Clostridiaceae bacterium]